MTAAPPLSKAFWNGSIAVLAGLVAALGPLPAPAAEPVTFHSHVATIIHEHCSVCHRLGGSGPFPLLTHRDVAQHAARIREVVTGGEMPPWRAIGDHGEFARDRRLSEQQKRLIERWIDAGCVQGEPTPVAAPVLPRAGWELGAPDVVLRPTPLNVGQGPASVLAVDVDVGDLWVTAIEISPRMTRFQHALLWLDLPATAEVLDVDETGQNSRRSLLLPNWLRDRLLAPAPSALRPLERAAAVAARDRRLVGVWAYDCLVQSLPEGTAFHIPAGSRLIVETPAVQSDALAPPLEIGLYVSDEPPQRIIVVAAVEGVSVHSNAVRETTRQGAFRVPVDCELQSISPHADAGCGEIRVGVTLPSGRRESLLWIDRWDSRWETSYEYRRPLQIPAGSRLDVQFLPAIGKRDVAARAVPQQAKTALVGARLIPLHAADSDELVRAMQRSQMNVARIPVQHSRLR